MIDYQMDEARYHARPELSSTQARQILDSPARYKWQLGRPARTSETFDIGHAVHSRVLGAGGAVIEYPEEHLTPSGAVSTKAATLAWATEQRDRGYIPVTASQVRQVNAMAEAVLAHKEARALLEKQGGNPEASVFATCDETGIELRARFDFLPDLERSDVFAVDLKTTGTRATARDFGKSVANYGYHIQQGHYLDTLALATGRDDIAMRFIVVEKAAPYIVAVHQLDDYYGHIGIDQAREARRILRECHDTNTWPTGLEEVQYLDAPSWLASDDITIGA